MTYLWKISCIIQEKHTVTSCGPKRLAIIFQTVILLTLTYLIIHLTNTQCDKCSYAGSESTFGNTTVEFPIKITKTISCTFVYMRHDKIWNTSYIQNTEPVQLWPSSNKQCPSWQSQVYDPMLFIHIWSQSSSSRLHSSTSITQKEHHTQKWRCGMMYKQFSN